MLISEISIKGYKSFGNNPQKLKLNTQKGELVLLVGSNGNGKSVVKSTEIEVDVPFEFMNLKDFISFLDIMGEESVYILHIKENNKTLYEEYVSYTRDNTKK